MKVSRLTKKGFAFVLCVTIFFTCLSTSFSYVTQFESLNQKTNQLRPVVSSVHSLEDCTSEIITRILQRNSTTEQYLTRNYSRVPLRMPVPPILLFFWYLFFFCYSKTKRYRQSEVSQTNTLDFSLIRYIHNQDGEIYHLFLSF